MIGNKNIFVVKDEILVRLHASSQKDNFLRVPDRDTILLADLIISRVNEDICT